MGGSIKTIMYGWCLCALFVTSAAAQAVADGDGDGFALPAFNVGTYAQRKAVVSGLPLQRLTNDAQQRILSIVKSPTLYRRLPTQAISCERDMFLFLTRNPDVLVGMWDLMGITNVQTNRTGPYQIEATDGSGTQCRVDLVYGDPNVHIFIADGSYDGSMVAKPIHGRGVFVVTSSYAKTADGRTSVTGTIDCFVQLESLGADLLARTLSGLIGRSADNNFVETARFMAQVSQASETNPPAMIDVAQRLPQVSEATRQQFINLITAIAHQVASQTESKPADRYIKYQLTR